MAHGPAVWLPFVQPFGTVFLGIGASLLAYQQWRTANEKLKLELFDKRSKLLGEAMKDYLEVFRHGEQDQESLKYLHFNLSRMSTLFDGDAARIASELLPDINVMIGKRVRASYADEVHAAFDNMVSKMPLLERAAMQEMKIRIPRTWW